MTSPTQTGIRARSCSTRAISFAGYSYRLRSAIMGSMRLARSAGIAEAVRPVTSRVSMMVPNRAPNTRWTIRSLGIAANPETDELSATGEPQQELQLLIHGARLAPWCKSGDCENRVRCRHLSSGANRAFSRHQEKTSRPSALGFQSVMAGPTPQYRVGL